MRLVLSLLVLAAFLAFPATAKGQSAGPTLQESFAIADRWAAKDAPMHPNHCAEGHVTIEFRPLVDSGGMAHGWFWNPWTQQHEWDYTACNMTIAAGMTASQTCWAIAHEIMHFVIGPQHDGPLDPAHPGAVECWKKRKSPARKYKRRIK